MLYLFMGFAFQGTHTVICFSSTIKFSYNISLFVERKSSRTENSCYKKCFLQSQHHVLVSITDFSSKETNVFFLIFGLKTKYT